MEPDRRVLPAAFAERAGIGLAEFHDRHGASGLIRCGKAIGSGQLTLASNVVTTAGHVFFAKGGKLRSPACTFEPTIEPGRSIAIDMRSIAAGSADPMQERATLDWAVARLAVPHTRVTPYAPGDVAEVPAPVLMYGGGNGRAAMMGAERCVMRKVTAVSPEGIRELSFDCSADHGGSGAALLNERNEIVGIFVGYRSIDAGGARPFSDLHYNFAITVEGPFRRALLEAGAAR